MIVIVDYGMGNLGSIQNMLKKVGARSIITSHPSQVAEADKLILPGVGAFDSAMTNLKFMGLVNALNHAVIEKQKPILGICLGMQLFTNGSEEGILPGLGWIGAKVEKFRFDYNEQLRVPHMGWNNVSIKNSYSIFNDFIPNARFYFVHSYLIKKVEDATVLTTTTYGYEFVSSFQRENIIGTQFHPEKSHKYGMQLLKKFVEMM